MDVNDIDTFNAELLNLLCACSANKDKEIENVCLISNEELEDNCIKLTCSHKFNYNSIFQEIKNQKRYSNLEVQKIKQHQIRYSYQPKNNQKRNNYLPCPRSSASHRQSYHWGQNQ